MVYAKAVIPLFTDPLGTIRVRGTRVTLDTVTHDVNTMPGIRDRMYVAWRANGGTVHRSSGRRHVLENHRRFVAVG
jgi:hypothetical protein